MDGHSPWLDGRQLTRLDRRGGRGHSEFFRRSLVHQWPISTVIRSWPVSHLIVLAYDDEKRANEALFTAEELRREGVIHLESASVVRRRADGAVEFTEAGDVSDRWATAGGAFSGLILGAALAVPVVGIGVGAAVGALAAHFSDLGIDDDFQRQIGEKLSPGRAALVMLGSATDRDVAIREASRFGGELMATDLPPEVEDRLRRAVAAAKVPTTSDAPSE